MPLKDFTGSSNNTPGPTGMGGGMPNMPMPNASADVDEFLVNYNEKFKTATPTLFRDGVIQQTLSVLIGKDKPNALLIGGAGVGKTKIVEEIARLIANDDPVIPRQLKDMCIYEFELSSIVSGSSYVGELEAKLDAVIDFASNKKNHAILFIDEIHMLASRDTQTYGKIGQLLKPALARGEIRAIGATTLQEAQDLQRDPAFNRRFSRIIVDELTREQTVQILEMRWGSLSAHYQNQIQIHDDAFRVVATIADQYATSGSHRPDTAVTLMDRACGDAIVDRGVQVANLNDPDMASALASVPITLTEAKIRDCARRLATGQAKQAKVDFNELDTALEEIKGQDEAIEKIVRKLRLREMNLFPQNKPLTILCAGPSGVGKSAVAKIVANQLTGSDPIILNMAEFGSHANLSRIVGSPTGYVGSDSHAELPFDALEANPYQVILLDEMEKGCREVQRFFMSAFDEGYACTAKGKKIDFSKAIFFVTTNASHTTGATRSCGFTNNRGSDDESTVKELSHWFDVELLNRFQLCLTFNEIDRDLYRTILADKYRRNMARILQENPRLQIAAELDDDKLEELVETSYMKQFGARPAERCVKDYIEDAALKLS